MECTAKFVLVVRLGGLAFKGYYHAAVELLEEGPAFCSLGGFKLFFECLALGVSGSGWLLLGAENKADKV